MAQTDSWKQVLVVDPDRESRERVIQLLREAAGDEGEGSEHHLGIIEAKDGDTAWAMLESARPDLLVCEILLEGLNGMQLLRRARERFDAEAPAVMFVTSMSAEVDRYWALRNGAAAFVVKPFEEGYFRERSARLLRNEVPEFDGNWPNEL
ncbi:response regulator [Pseudenhygromyxa sp. WMMC2535]|uniref:response regulator n=1 Tax=Pseudenhygromyxa sp. WMMC2535 TaxID=2712867 RepID=UPI0015578911|nr:response regulator [Pseudenhygromyxa sp. WMMC2535]NVB40455.1 response regulator [Pseudenhygromyxa sp. WMMC2535]